jgi:hypothetical protein
MVESASPTGFFVYSTAKVFTAPPVTDAFGNVACGTLLSFSNVPSSASACVPTFQAMNSNAAAYYDSNGDPAVEIALTAPFIHIPTRTEVQISPSEVCAQGNGTVNYGYPAQQVLDYGSCDGRVLTLPVHQSSGWQRLLCSPVSRYRELSSSWTFHQSTQSVGSGGRRNDIGRINRK